MKERISVWQDEIKLKPSRPKLEKNLKTEILIIGAGVTGITTAYLLAKNGRKVTVIEKDYIGSGETSRTTAFLNYHVDTYLQKIKEMFNEEKAIEVWTSEKMMIDAIEYIAKNENIECEFFRCPLYLYATSRPGYRMLEEEYEIAYKHGFAVKLEQKEMGFPYNQFLKIGENGKFHPLKYLTGLAKKAEEYGAQIYENTQFLDYEGKGKIKTEQGIISADEIIFCTYNPANITLEIHNRVTSNQTYILAAQIPKDIIPEAVYIDTETPYHYFRIDKKAKYDRIILGGEDHKTGEAVDTAERHKKLEEYLKKIIPKVDYEITHRWSGQVIDPFDGLPYIGKMLTHRSQYVGTGYAGDGMTFGTLAGFINSDLIAKKRNPWTDLYSLKRLKKPTKVLKSGYKVLKRFISGRIRIEEISLERLAKNSGEIGKMENKKVAAYKDKDGNITRLSPVCTHMGCIVQWNNAAKTWDCPCHGSRYTAEGEVQNGPARRKLEKLK